MRKIKILVGVLVLVLAVTFTFDCVNVSAKTTKSKTKAKSTASKKLTSKKSASKKSASKKSKSSSKRRKTVSKKQLKKKSSRKKVSSRGRTLKRSHVYSRGSGSVLDEGNALKVVNYAKRFLGVHYDFGSSSSSAFDCSGFTMYAYKIAGVDLPHSASGQANLGLAVSKDNLKPGDLVFFETYKPGISHVGIYVGNGYFIHASSGAGYVTITSLSEAYYTERYRGATRILGD